MSEIKSYKGYIEEKNDYQAKTSESALAANVNASLVDEIKKKRPSIQEFTAYAAANQSADNYRSNTNPSLVTRLPRNAPRSTCSPRARRRSSSTSSEGAAYARPTASSPSRAARDAGASERSALRGALPPIE